MAQYIIKNRSESTIEIIVPAHLSNTGYDVQVLIPRSMSMDVSLYSSNQESILNLPHVKKLVARTLVKVYKNDNAI